MSSTAPDIVRAQFEESGIEIVSCEVVRDFPWSLVLRMQASDGSTVWAKRCGDGMSFEPELVRVIEGVGSPILVPTVWMAERWIATRHVEGPLGRGGHLIDSSLRLQAPLAQLQQGLATRLDAVRQAGTPSLGHADVGDLVDRALALGAPWPDYSPLPGTQELVHDPRLAAFIRIDALAAALHTGSDEQRAPFADWLADLVRAAAAPRPEDAVGVRLA